MKKILILITVSLLISCNINKKENKVKESNTKMEIDTLSVYNNLLEKHLYNQYLGRKWELLYINLHKKKIDSSLYLKQLSALKSNIIENDSLKGTLYINNVFNGYERNINFLKLSEEFDIDEVKLQIGKKNHLQVDSLKSNFVKLKSLSKKKEDTLKQFEVGILSLSKFILNKDKTLGMLYFEFICGGKCGEGSLITIKKTNNKWHVKKEYTLWEI